MGDTRRVVQALDGVQRHTRGRRFFRVPVLMVARSREADSLAEAVENSLPARQAGGRKSLLRPQLQGLLPRRSDD